ncbi:MAG: peptidoglycan recognition family protein [Phycisphaerales bacterium]
MHQQVSDDCAMRSPISRREALGGGLLLTLAALSGCGTPQRSVPVAAAANSSPVTPYIPGPLPVPAEPAPAAPVGGQVTVIPRSVWTRSGPIPGRVKNPMNGVRRITVHHAGDQTFSETGQAAVAAKLESIRQYHTTRTKSGTSEKWADIGYHYIIDPAGRVWEGRSVAWQGAHVQAQNENNLGIMLLGNFDQQRPTAAALASLDAFLIDQMRRFGVPRSRVYTHRELNATACPGRNLQSHMVATRSRGGRLAMVAAELGLA